MKITIEKIINEGFGLGRDQDGKSIFVKKTVPGDVLDVEITRDKKNFAEAQIEKIIEPSERRISPICPNFDQCGGCEHMNLSYKDQLSIKAQIIKEIFDRAKISKIPLPIISGSDNEFYYRNVMRFLINTNRDNELEYCMHNFDYKSGTIPIEKCFLLSEKSNEILSTFKNFVNSNIENKEGLWQIRIREGKFTDEIMIEIMTDSNILPKEKEVAALLKEIPEVKSIYHSWSKERDLNKLKRRLLFGSPVIFEKIGKYKFQISPESFFQTNSLGVKTLYDKIKEFADVKIGESILDLYCGTGTIGIYLSTLAKKVTGIEIVPQAIRDARDNAKINRIQNCEFICADASHIQNYELSSTLRDEPSGSDSNERNENYDVIIVDPPRSGLSKEVISYILNTKCSKLVYVSCNPATFARDIKLLEAKGLKLQKVQPIDMFPQTHHIECVGLIGL